MKLLTGSTGRVCVCLVLVLVLANPFVYASDPDWRAEAAAHQALTDGLRGSSGGDGWVRLYADSTKLPKLSYDVGDFALWGISGPNYGFSPSRQPHLYEQVRDAGIRGVRYDVQWAQVQFYGPHLNLWNANNLEYDINRMVSDGFSVQCVVGFFPAWSNGLRYRAVPPNKPVEAELVSFGGQPTLQLAYPSVITALPDEMPVVVAPYPLQTEPAEDVVTGFTAGSAPRASKWPILVDTARVWVAEPPSMEFREWTRVENLIDSPDQAEHFQLDRDGRVKFRNDSFFLGHGRTPAAGSSVKISYDHITAAYVENVDYRLNNLTGQLARIGGDVAAAVSDDSFDQAGLAEGWQWMNPPVIWDAGLLVPGHLSYTSISTSPIGHFLYQELSGSGDFSVSMRTSAAPGGANQVNGIMVYKDENNWFRYGYGYLYGPHLCRCVNGVIEHLDSISLLGGTNTLPGWLNVRKVGNSYTVFASTNSTAGPDSGYQVAYTFQMDLGDGLKVGISSTREKTSAPTGVVNVDRFKIQLPAISPDQQLAVFYNYLDTQPFCSFIYDLVDHFKDRVKFWEIVNEPNTAFCWRGGIDIYGKLLADAAAAVRAADPEAQVLNGGLANGKSENLATIYDYAGAASIDYAAWHPYTFSNKEPGVGGWDVGPESTNGNNRSIMLRYGQEQKMAFFGEVATPGGVISRGGPMNERLQADYAMRTFLLTRKLGWAKALQWHPAVDIYPVGEQESNMNGGHEGLFYEGSLVPKPVFYAYRNAASNKGFLVDLVSFDSQSRPVPEPARHTLAKVTVGVREKAKVASVRVFTSLTATDSASRPPRVAARHVGQAAANPIVVNIDTTDPDLVTEVWEAVATTPLTFSVSGSISGEQGMALVGESFSSDNGVATFTIPVVSKLYLPGDKFTFETFAGDGFELAGSWDNPGQSGAGDIEVPLPEGSQARYLSVQFVEAPGTGSFEIDEVLAIDAGGANVASGKLYLIDGHQLSFREFDPAHVGRVGALRSMPDGTQVQMAGQALHQVGEEFGYICDIDRSAGIRVQGTMDGLRAGRMISLEGVLRAEPGRERYIELTSIQDLGPCDLKPLAMKNRCARRANSVGLPVTIFGRVIEWDVASGVLKVSDGSHPEGIRIGGLDEPPPAGDDVIIISGASGFDGQSIIYANCGQPEDDE